MSWLAMTQLPKTTLRSFVPVCKKTLSQAGGLRAVVLSGHIDPVVALHAGVDALAHRAMLGQLAARHALLLGRFGAERVGSRRGPRCGEGCQVGLRYRLQRLFRPIAG